MVGPIGEYDISKMKRGEDKVDKGEKMPRKIPVYPMSAERELQRVNNAYMAAVIKISEPYIKKLMKMYESQTRNDSRFDDIGGFRDKLTNIILELANDLGERLNGFALTKMIKRAGEIAKSTSLKDWMKLVKDTIGVEPVKEYYDDLLRESMQKWVENNVSYVQSIPSEYLVDLQNIILWGYETHQPMVNVYRRIEKVIGTSKSKARVLARDQMGTLNSQMMRYEQESMGVNKYMWKTRRDDRVRTSHRLLDKKIFSWDSPPPMWYETKSKGIVYTGRNCHPGEDYMCRCVAVPIFDKDIAAGKIEKQRIMMRR